MVVRYVLTYPTIKKSSVKVVLIALKSYYLDALCC